MDLELCCNDYSSALLADHFNFKRLELCANLAAGGLTPSAGTIAKVVQDIKAECHVLIRPRSGDFNYSDEEITVMAEDIRFCKTIGCRGVVFGVMDKNNRFELDKNLILLEAAEGMESTFHRALDISSNFEKDIESIINCGFNRVLTSGGEASAEKGIKKLSAIRKLTLGKIELMIGGGVNAINIQGLVTQVNPDAIHFSASEKTTSGNGTLFEGQVLTATERKVREILEGLEM